MNTAAADKKFDERMDELVAWFTSFEPPFKINSNDSRLKLSNWFQSETEDLNAVENKKDTENWNTFWGIRDLKDFIYGELLNSIDTDLERLVEIENQAVQTKEELQEVEKIKTMCEVFELDLEQELLQLGLTHKPDIQ